MGAGGQNTYGNRARAQCRAILVAEQKRLALTRLSVAPAAVRRRGWPNDPSRVGFSIRTVNGKVHLYYNAEFPPFLDMKNKMSRRSLETEFVSRYEVRLVLHTIFTLNYDFVDEEEFAEEQRKRMRNLLCATAESLALATKSELEIESKLKSDDSAPLATAIAGDLKAAATAGKEAGAAVAAEG